MNALARRGVKGTSSYTRWPDAVPDTQQVTAAVTQNHFDGVITLVRLEDRFVTTTSPGQIRRESVTYIDTWGRAITRYRDVQEPDQTTTEMVLSFQSDVWRTSGETGRLIWSGTVQTPSRRPRTSWKISWTTASCPAWRRPAWFPRPGGSSEGAFNSRNDYVEVNGRRDAFQR